MRSFFLAVLQMFTAPDYHRCLVQVMGGRQAEAVTAFARYQQKYPADPRSHDGLALALFMNHRFEEALGEADRALEAAPTAERLHLRGAILSHLGDDEGALQDFEASLRLKPGFQESEFGLTAVLLNLRRLDSAIGFLERSRRWWRPPHYFLYLGEAYRLRGMLDAATDAYQMAVRTPLAIGLGLSSGAAQQGFFAYLLVNAGKLKEAEKAAQRSLAKDPRQPLALLAQAAVQKEKSDPALENTLERLLEVNPNYVVAELTDPEFTPLLADERFRALLARAWQERDRILGRVRQRPGITQSGAAN
jgi:tetratricopeptide (TPR) repeat protein